MAALRQNVFVEKVLKKLYANAPRGRGKRARGTPAPVKPPVKAAPEKVACQSAPPRADKVAAGGSTAAPPGRRLYTVSLPPDGVLPVWTELPPIPVAQSSSSSEAEATADKDLHDQPKRRRIKKHKSKRRYANFSAVPAEKAELEKQQGLSWKNLPPCHTDGPAMSKNKKRKLKKKQQIQRKKAAGLLARQTSSMNFLYQPEEGSSEPGDEDEEDGPGPEPEVVTDAQEPGADLQLEVSTEDQEPEVGTEAQEPGAELEPEVGTEDPEEGASRTNVKADDILTFLKSTQELCFFDATARNSELSAAMGAAAQLLEDIETHGLPCSDVLILNHMKTLLFLENTERLKHTLEMFPEHCLMPPDHARVISAFFSYWLTHVLPQKQANSE